MFIYCLVQLLTIFTLIPYFWNASRTFSFFLLLRYSPICFLSIFGFSLRNCTTCAGSSGEHKRLFSCRNATPFAGLLLNKSAPVCKSWGKNRTAITNIQLPLKKYIAYNRKVVNSLYTDMPVLAGKK